MVTEQEQRHNPGACSPQGPCPSLGLFPQHPPLHSDGHFKSVRPWALSGQCGMPSSATPRFTPSFTFFSFHCQLTATPHSAVVNIHLCICRVVSKGKILGPKDMNIFYQRTRGVSAVEPSFSQPPPRKPGFLILATWALSGLLLLFVIWQKKGVCHFNYLAKTLFG